RIAYLSELSDSLFLPSNGGPPSPPFRPIIDRDDQIDYSTTIIPKARLKRRSRAQMDQALIPCKDMTLGPNSTPKANSRGK
ncbi:hypothetical protein HAX54_014565, partial [Datura stramonium]|nr:hypothetical protein [Datura stramonium]